MKVACPFPYPQNLETIRAQLMHVVVESNERMGLQEEGILGLEGNWRGEKDKLFKELVEGSEMRRDWAPPPASGVSCLSQLLASCPAFRGDWCPRAKATAISHQGLAA